MTLIAALVALFGGPLLQVIGAREPRAHAFVDGFVFVTVAGLVLLGLLPEAVELMGPVAVAWAAAGFLLLAAIEQGFARTAPGAHSAILVLALAGLALHQLLDGVALHQDAAGSLATAGIEPGHDPGRDPGHDHGHGNGSEGGGGLTLAIVLHNIPLGIAVWFLAAHAWGHRLAVLVLVLLAGITALGFLLGPRVLAALNAPGLNAFQAFLAGSVLHVVVHGGLASQGLAKREGTDPSATGPVAGITAERLGTLAGVALLAAWW